MTDILSFVQPASVVNTKGSVTTVFGDAGQGKTTFCYWCWPQPLFIPIEPGLKSIPHAHAVPTPENSSHIDFYLKSIESKIDTDPASFPYKTIVLDSVSELDTLITREVCIANNVQSVASMGWGKGQAAVANRQREIKEICSRLAKKGLHIVAISHAESREIALPDTEPYTRWTLQLVRGSAKEWTNQVDAVIHIKSMVSLAQSKGSEHVIAKTIPNKRIVDMVPRPSSVCKNRFMIMDTLEFNFDPQTNSFNNPIANIYNFV